MIASYAMSQAAALLGDPGMTWATATFQVPYMQYAMDRCVEDVLKIPDLGIITDLVIIPDVPIGTTDLSAYAGAGGPLELLSGLLSLKERATSTRDELSWTEIDEVADMPTYMIGPFNDYYSISNNVIRLHGANQTTDIRVFGKFTPAPILSSDTAIISGLSAFLAAKTASLIAGSRENERRELTLANEALSHQQSYLANSIMEVQAVRTRMRSFSGRI